MLKQDDNWQLADVTQKTGQKIAGPLTSWQTQDGPNVAEHVAAASPGGDLLVFYFEPRFDWQFVNVTQKTGQKIAGPLTSWQTQDGPNVAEHVAAASPGGDLLVFYFEPRFDWQFVNVTQKTGQKIAGPLTSWQTQDGPNVAEHVAAMSPGGDPLVWCLSNWVAVGPGQQNVPGTVPGNFFSPWGGRIDWIDISSNFDGSGHPAMYLATPGGGVWRSSDFLNAAPTWTPLTDHLPGIPDSRRDEINKVSTLAVDPQHPQTVYAGTGTNQTSILKSTDGGDSWDLIGEGQIIGTILTQRVLADPSGTVYAAFIVGGFWRSENGGLAWANIADARLAGVEFHDAVYFIDKDGQLAIYVGIVDRQGGTRSGVWSLVSGQWTQMPMTMTNLHGKPFMPSAINHITLSATSSTGVCASLSQHDDDKALVGLLNVFKLEQGTWQPQWSGTASDWFITQNGYVQPIYIAPDGRLYAGGRGLAQSEPGNSFVGIDTDSHGRSIHIDKHVVIGYQDKIYVGTDGGLTYFTPIPGQPGVTAWESLNTPSLQNFLSTGASTHPINPAVFIVGNQDNGIARRGQTGTWSQSWFSNERERLRFDPDPTNNGRYAFSVDPKNGFYMSSDEGVSFNGFGPPGVPATDQAPPFAIHPENSARIILGWPDVWETLDRGGTWQKITSNPEAPSALTYGNGDTTYIGVGDHLFETNDHGQTMSAVNFDFAPFIVSLCTDPDNPDSIYVATRSRILRRLGAAGVWEELTGNLGQIINVMALLQGGNGRDPSLFVGTPRGVFSASQLSGANTIWTRFGANFPDVDVRDLEVGTTHRLLLAATYGRGAWTALV